MKRMLGLDGMPSSSALYCVLLDESSDASDH